MAGAGEDKEKLRLLHKESGATSHRIPTSLCERQQVIQPFAPQFTYLKNGSNNIFLLRLLRELNGFMDEMCPEKCLIRVNGPWKLAAVTGRE